MRIFNGIYVNYSTPVWLLMLLGVLAFTAAIIDTVPL